MISTNRLRRRTMKRKNMKDGSNIMRFAGAWKNVDDKEIENMKKSISDLRKRSSLFRLNLN